MARFGSFASRIGFSLALGAAAAPVYACGSDDNGTSTGSDAGTKPVADASPSDASGKTLALPFKPSNIDLTGVDLSMVADVDITSSCTFQYGATSGIADCGGNDFIYAYLTQSDLSGVGVYIAKSIHIEPGVVVNADSGRPFVLVSLTTFLDQGTIDVSADSLPGGGGAGGFSYSGDGDAVGLGQGGGSAGSDTLAGGGGGYCGVGGAGGNITVGGAANPGGPAWGTKTLIPLIGGSTGGAAAEDPGGGGGAVQLIAGTTFTLDTGAKIGAGGGPGNESGDDNQQSAGGGSGGAVLIEAASVVISGTIAANGGGGGGSGGDGTVGSTVLAAAPGGGVNGGAGSAGTSIAGAAGTPTTGSDPGGGGGGAGRIRINSTSGVATITGTLSPDISTTCVSQGTLGH